MGETILEWNDKDIEHYHARRMAMDSMLCRFKATYPAERIDSVRSLLEDKERQMFQIVRLMDEQQSINKKIANQIPVIVQKSVQEQSKKPKRKGFLGIFGKKRGTKPTTTTTTLRSSNRNMVNEQKAQSRRLSEQADSLAARNAELNRQLQGLICQIEKKVQSDLQNRESEITAMRKKSFMQIGGLMKGFAQAFGDAMTDMPTGKATEVAFGTTQTWAGISFEFCHGATSDFPGASILIGGKAYYTHWTPAKAHVSHLQISSPAAIDAEIAEAEKSLASSAELFIGGHGGATKRDAVEFKIAYLKKMKELLAANKSSQDFVDAMKKLIPVCPEKPDWKIWAKPSTDKNKTYCA